MVYIILGKGFEPVEAIAPCDILRRGGVDVKLAGIGGKLITGQAPGASFAFGLKLLAALRGEQTAADVAEGMVIRG